MKKYMKTLLAALLAIGLLAMTGCNTVKGLGQDFEALGQSMQSAGD